MESEEFVLKEREGDRLHRTVRISILVGAVLLMAAGFGIRSCALSCNEVERERIKEEASLERVRIADFTKCLEKQSREECARAYYPERKDPLTAAEHAELEADRAERARVLYVHCTENTSVRDKYCDDEVVRIMDAVGASR